jgi:hypothetical protein
MSPRPHLALIACLLGSCTAWAAAPQADVQAAALMLQALPRPATPPPESGPVVPTQVQGWREEGTRYEYGEGVPRDAVRAAQLYCRAARYGDAQAQFSLAWMLTNARGIERDDAQAAHLFAAAARGPGAGAQHGGQPGHTARRAAAVLACAGPGGCAGQGRAAQGGGCTVIGVVPGAVVAAPPNAPEPIVRFVNLIAPEYKVAPQLVLAVMAAESNFDPLALSPKKAQGLMQLMPDTATRFKVRRIEDPAQNIRGGMAYLRWLLAYFEGDLTLVLAAYNAGEGAVERYRGVPPYAETRNYVQRILSRLDGSRLHPFDPAVTAPTGALRVGRAAPGLR